MQILLQNFQVVRISRSSGQGQGHRSKKAFDDGLPSIERPKCFIRMCYG